MPTFQSKLAAVLGERNMGYRTLARLIDPDNIESQRRSIRKWMAGAHQPTSASRGAVTDALGLERGALDSDDEEDSLLSVLMAGLEKDPKAARVLRQAFERLSA